MAYISFVGYMQEPHNSEALKELFPMEYSEEFCGVDSLGDEVYRDVEKGTREGLQYESIGGQDSLTVYLAKVNNTTGHLVADCPAGGWVGECFVVLDENGQPMKSSNYNPNPWRQIALHA